MDLKYGDLYIGKEIYCDGIQCFIYAIHWDRSCLGDMGNVRIGLMNVEKVNPMENVHLDTGITYWRNLKDRCGRPNSVNFISKA